MVFSGWKGKKAHTKRSRFPGFRKIGKKKTENTKKISPIFPKNDGRAYLTSDERVQSAGRVKSLRTATLAIGWDVAGGGRITTSGSECAPSGTSSASGRGGGGCRTMTEPPGNGLSTIFGDFEVSGRQLSTIRNRSPPLDGVCCCFSSSSSTFSAAAGCTKCTLNSFYRRRVAQKLSLSNIPHRPKLRRRRKTAALTSNGKSSDILRFLGGVDDEVPADESSAVMACRSYGSNNLIAIIV